eukprot:10970874-Alexandrium_andersonii.AAC.1
MSASLVGSEMCIRDSTDMPSSSRPAPACAGPAGGSDIAPVSSACPLTVSYTHLTLPTICSV